MVLSYVCRRYFGSITRSAFALNTGSVTPNKNYSKMSSDNSANMRPPIAASEAEDMPRDKCLFCQIADEKSQDLTRLIYKDDEIVAFPDIRPAAKYHYLIVPKQHIKSAKVMVPSQIQLVDRLVEIGTKLVNEKIIADNAAEGKEVNIGEIPKLYGFHWPPFHSIAHLHLHVIAPSNSMGFISRQIFRPNSWWFVTPEYVKERLAKEARDGRDQLNSPKC